MITGLSSVHTRLSTLAATLNATLNQLLGGPLLCIMLRYTDADNVTVHGPPYVRLGFAGAPIATAACYNFVAVASGLYILFSLRPTHRRRAENDEPNVPAPERPTFLFGLSLISLLGLGGVGRITHLDFALLRSSSYVNTKQHASLLRLGLRIS